MLLVVEEIIGVRPSPLNPKAGLRLTNGEDKVNICEDGVCLLRPVRGVDKGRARDKDIQGSEALGTEVIIRLGVGGDIVYVPAELPTGMGREGLL